MPTGPQGPDARGNRPGIKTPSWLDATGDTPQPRPNMAPSRYSGASAQPGGGGEGPSFVRRILSVRHVRLGLVAAVVVSLGVAGWSMFWGPPTSCRRSAARKAAVKTLVQTRDAVTGEPLSERFDRGDFRCADVAATEFAPPGVLVETNDGEDPVTWFFDSAGTAYNVNQLAAAWTPSFPASPKITTEQLASVRE